MASDLGDWFDLYWQTRLAMSERDDAEHIRIRTTIDAAGGILCEPWDERFSDGPRAGHPRVYTLGTGSMDGWLMPGNDDAYDLLDRLGTLQPPAHVR